MGVVSETREPNGRAKTRPVPVGSPQAAAAVSRGCAQVFENLYESQRNTNVMEITERSDNLRENINLIWVLCRPKPDARCWLQGPIPRVFPGCPGGPAGLNDRLLQCRKMSAIGGS